MAQYINKDTLVAEIKRKIKEIEEMGTYLSPKGALTNLLCHLDAFEVKEVDLEKYLKEDIEDVFFDLEGVAIKGATHYITVEDVKDIAKHFFELGLKVQKENNYERIKY